MRLGIMQPYFFPYIGYWQLINAVDEFIIFDIVQFIRHGWIERNRILKPQEGWQYISAPLEKHHRETLIKDIRIKNGNEWKDTIIRQLSHYKKRAPFFNNTIDLLYDIFLNDYDTITQFNYNAISKICSYLNINTKIVILKELNLEIEYASAPDEWALNICKKIPECNEYWNPEGGKTFFNEQKYITNNIKIRFLKAKNIEYNQHRDRFEPYLSIIDVMMFNSQETIKKMLTDYELI